MTEALPAALERDAVALEWASLLPKEEDSVSQRRLKLLQLQTALRAKERRLDAAYASARQGKRQRQESSQPAAAPARPQQPSPVAPGEQHPGQQPGQQQQSEPPVQSVQPPTSLAPQQSTQEQGAEQEHEHPQSAQPPAFQQQEQQQQQQQQSAQLALPRQDHQQQAQPPAPALQQLDSSSGWRPTVRGSRAAERQQQRPGSGVPSPAADGPCTTLPLAEGYHTPCSARMLPGPGRVPLARQQGGSALQPAALTASTGPSSSGGIPTVSTGGLNGSVAPGHALAGRRLQQRGAPAVGSGRVALSAGGFLSTAGRPPLRSEPLDASGPSQPLPLLVDSGGAGDAQRARRRWAAQRQQTQQLGPIERFLQPSRPSRLGPDAAAAAAPSSLTTQIGPTQSQLPGSGPGLDPEAARLAEAMLLGPAPEPSAWQEEVVEEAQQQQHAQAQQQQPQQEDKEEQQAAPVSQQDGAAPPPLQQCQQQQRGSTPARQQHPRGRTPARLAQAVGTAAMLGTGSLLGGTGMQQGTGVLVGSDWTLPPTPSCMKALSPMSPAAAAAAAGTDAVAAAGPGSVAPGRANGSMGVGGVPGSAARVPDSLLRHPGSVATAAKTGGGRGLALRRVQEYSYAAETPQLFVSENDGSAAQEADSEARQLLFVAETPCDSAPAGVAPSSATEQRRQAAAGTAAAAAAALERAAAAAAPAAPAAGAAARTPAAGAASPAVAAAGGLVGLQLQLPDPVLHAVPCPDGRHLALLLSSFGTASEPQQVLVLHLPDGPGSSGGGEQTPATGGGMAAASAVAGVGGGVGGVRVVASVAVERSRWSHQGEELTPNCLQLANTERAGLQLILSAALQLADHPAASAPQPAILVQSLNALAKGAGSTTAGGSSSAADAAPVGQRQPGQRGLRQRRRQAVPGLLTIESREPLTCVALAGGNRLLASGDGPAVHLLDFDPSWSRYTWGKLPNACYRTADFEDVTQLLPFPDPEGASRRLLLGLSGSGALALWDVGRCQLLAARAHPTYRLRALQPVSMRGAGLATPAKQRVAAAAAAAAEEGAPHAGLHLFVGLVEHRTSRQKHVAAIALTSGSLLVSSSSALPPAAPPPVPPMGRQQQEAAAAAEAARRVTVLAGEPGGRRCWVGTAGGGLLSWDLASGRTLGPAAGCAAEGNRGAVSCACAMPPGGNWALVAGTAGGACTLLARPSA